MGDYSPEKAELYRSPLICCDGVSSEFCKRMINVDLRSLAGARSLRLPRFLQHGEDRRSASATVRGRLMLAQVRHDCGQKTAKSFRISSGNRRVYTTFSIQFEPLRETEAKLLE